MVTDAASAPDRAGAACLKSAGPTLLHVDALGDGTALAAALGEALGTPLPMPVIAEPEGARRPAVAAPRRTIKSGVQLIRLHAAQVFSLALRARRGSVGAERGTTSVD